MNEEPDNYSKGEKEPRKKEIRCNIIINAPLPRFQATRYEINQPGLQRSVLLTAPREKLSCHIIGIIMKELISP